MVPASGSGLGFEFPQPASTTSASRPAAARLIVPRLSSLAVRLIHDPTEPLALEDDLMSEGDNARGLHRRPAGAFDRAYAAPPFNTGKHQRRGDHGYADVF